MMNKILRITGITIALTAIGVGVRARVRQKQGSIKGANIINIDLADLNSAPSLKLPTNKK